MEKRIWTRPEKTEVAFAANDYVAACGDRGTEYLFKCDAGGGKLGYVWVEDNEKDGLQSGSGYWEGTPGGGGSPNDEYDDFLNSYYACGKEHVANAEDDFLNGYYLEKDKWNDGNFNLLDAIKVIIWRGTSGNNVHCTTELDKNNWEIAKS